MTLLAEPVLSMAVADHYMVRDPTEIRAFLAARPHMTAFLEDAPQHIAQFFPGAPLWLEYQVDPDDGKELLLLRVSTDHAPVDALARLEHLLNAWYLDLPLITRREALVVL